jgi:hypothetical protein
VDQAGVVQVSQLPPAQYYYDIGNAPFTNGKKGMSMPSNILGYEDLTVEAWVNFYQLQQVTVFDIGEAAQSTGNIYLGLSGGGRPKVVIQGTSYDVPAIVPPTKQWVHVGVQLETRGSVFFVNVLYNGQMYFVGQHIKNNMVGWGTVLMLGQNMGGDYSLSGGISNVRVSTSAVYANPWTPVPVSYPLAFPFAAAPFTVVLVQGSGPSNVENPSQSITKLTQISSLYVPTLYSNIPPGKVGALNFASGWLYETVSWSWTNVTMEAWINVPSRKSDTIGIFDTRAFQSSTPNNAGVLYINPNGTLGLYAASSGLHALGSATVPLNTWSHVAWVLYNGTWSSYIDGILTATLPNSSAAVGSSATNLTLGGDASSWNLTNYKYNGSIFQPMVTAKAKYTANFTPAVDLSVGASSDPVLFFLNPGVSGGFQDLATGQSMSMGGNAVTQSVRYLTS